MRSKALDLQTSVVSVYDQTKTTVIGRAAQKTILSRLALGTPLNSFADVLTDANLTPLHFHITGNGNAFIFNAPAAGVGTIAHYTFSFTTGAWVYVGKLAYSVPNSPATTHTIRAVRVDDSSTPGSFKIFVNTVGTVTANGGLFMLGHGSAPVTVADFVPVGFATLVAATAANQKAVYFLQETGGTNLLLASQGMIIDTTTTRIYIGNNTAATFQGYIFNYAATITTVNAGGITSDMYVLKTGTLPGISGTILLLNNFNLATPTASSGVPAGLQGQTCISIPSGTAFNIGKVSEWTSGATTWPSLDNRNLADTPSTNITPTITTGHFSNTLQRFIMAFAIGRWAIKTFVSNGWELNFGNASNPQFRTAVSNTFQEFGAVTVASTFTANGWIFQASSSAGHIGILAFDLQSADLYDTNYVVSKVIDLPKSPSIKTIRFTSPLRSFARLYYRTTGFGVSTGNWVAGPLDGDFSGISFAGVTQIQFKLMPRFERDGSTVPIQYYEGFIVYVDPLENSDRWSMDHENTTKSTETPPKSAAYLNVLYTTSVPSITMSAFSKSTGALVLQKNTVTHAAEFSYSTALSGGAVWNALGTVPNVVGTRLRYNWSTPIPEDVDVVWTET